VLNLKETKGRKVVRDVEHVIDINNDDNKVAVVSKLSIETVIGFTPDKTYRDQM
jgi:hypothetical protein